MTETFRGRLERLLERADQATTAYERGEALENLLGHILDAVPGVKVVARRKVNEQGSEEIDLGILIKQTPGGLEGFEAYAFGECKNWAKPVGASELRDFAGKLESRGQRIGILAARNGITGNAEAITSAQAVVALNLSKGREILVVTRGDMAGLLEPDDVADLLLRKRTGLIMSAGAVDFRWLDEETTDDVEPGHAEFHDRSIADAIRSVRIAVVERMIASASPLPEDVDDAAEVLIDATNHLDRDIPRDEFGGPLEWQTAVDSMVRLGSVGVAFLARDAIAGHDDPEYLASSAAHNAPASPHLGPSSTLFRDLVSYYALEVSNTEELARDKACYGLIGLLADAIWRLEEQLREFDAEPAEG